MSTPLPDLDTLLSTLLWSPRTVDEALSAIEAVTQYKLVYEYIREQLTNAVAESSTAGLDPEYASIVLKRITNTIEGLEAAIEKARKMPITQGKPSTEPAPAAGSPTIQ